MSDEKKWKYSFNPNCSEISSNCSKIFLICYHLPWWKTCLLFVYPNKSDENNILTACSNHHLWCLSFFSSYLSNLFVASFLLAHISIIYVWWPNQKRYFVTRNFLMTTEATLSLRQRNQTFYLSKGKIGNHKFWFPFSLAFAMRCFKSSKICWIEINIAKLMKYW